MDVNDGKITKLEPKDVYETDGQLGQNVTPPPGIDQVADRWYMRDANYSPDFPTSAKKIMWFLEKSRGPSVDTVIAIDQTVAEEFLDLIGPIFINSSPFKISTSNFDYLFSFYSEAKVAKGQPRKNFFLNLLKSLKKKLCISKT